MSRRTAAGVVAVPLLLLLLLVAAVFPVPYVAYGPGPTVDVLAEQGGEEIVQVSGAHAPETYRTGGELRMTTVNVTPPRVDLGVGDWLRHPIAALDEVDRSVNLFEAMSAWLDPDEAIVPYDAVYPPDQTRQDAESEGAAQMVSSQDTAIAVALHELGYDVTPNVEVLAVIGGMPADGKLKKRDVILKIDDTEVTEPQDVVDAIDKVDPGDRVTFVVRRDHERVRVPVTTKDVDGEPRVGIYPGPGYTFPFDVSVRIPESIGGPSAGLMFSLAIYDTLTPGSLTGGRVVAGTGTVDDQGNVGPIGGIQQKIVAADDAKAELFLVPADNCKDALDAPVDDIRLVKATTMHEARTAIRTWVRDPDAALPSCEAGQDGRIGSESGSATG